MRSLFSLLKRILSTAWGWLREWSGDAAYERYQRSRATILRRERELSRTEFYLDQLRRKYSRPSRCC